MPNETSLNAIIVQMETLGQTVRESKITEMAIGKSPHKLACLQMVHSSGRRDSDSEVSDLDYGLVHSEQASYFESDESADCSDSDIQQGISSQEAQLAKLKTSVDRKSHTRKMYNDLHNFDKSASCVSC